MIDRLVLKDEITQLFGFLEMLLMSCADHEVTTDIFISPANPVAYRTALEGVRYHSDRIAASGMTRENLVPLFEEHGGDYCPLLEGLVEPRELIPLIGSAFTPVQEILICTACKEWAIALAPEHPDTLAELIRSAVHPLTLADLLSPEATGMLRFPAILHIQNAGRRLFELVRPGGERGTRIVIPATDDRALFCGQLNAAIFWFISDKGIIPNPYFAEPVFQALYDIGVLGEGGIDVLSRNLNDEGPLINLLFTKGKILSGHQETITDIRILFRLVLTQLQDINRSYYSPSPDGEIAQSFSRIKLLSGHVLAGFISSRAEVSGQACVNQVLDFISSIAARPSGKAVPGADQLRELERNVQECEQLIRVITGDYAWRATPMHPSTGGYRPVADLWSGKHLLLYDQDEMAYQTTEVVKAHVMEALYSYLYGLKLKDNDTITDHEDWYVRLVSVLSVPRAVQTGSSVHPGVTRWIDGVCREECDPVNQIVKSTRITSMSLPDQFLEAAVFEGRTGGPVTYIQDVLVQQALDKTSRARTDLVIPQTTDEICRAIINGHIWPVFRQLCDNTQTVSQGASVLTGRARKGSVQNTFKPRGTTSSVDTTVPDAHPHAGHLTGKKIEGKEQSLVDNDGLLVPGSHTGQGAQAARSEAQQNGQNAQPAGPGNATVPCPFPGDAGGQSGNVDGVSGSRETANRMMEACRKSEDLLDKLSSPGSNADAERDGKPTPHTMISALRDLADTIEDLSKTLENRARGTTDMNSPDINGQTPPSGVPNQKHKSASVSDDLVKTSKNVRKAAGEYREALEKLERKIESSGSDPGRIRHLTGMTRKSFMALQQAGTEFQRLSGIPSHISSGNQGPIVRLREADDDPDSEGTVSATRRGRLEPSFVADTGYTPGIWEGLSYFDASFDDDMKAEPEGLFKGRHPRDTAERRLEQGSQALTREAEQYISALQQRTTSEWETIDEKAEWIRKVALFESHTVGQDDYESYQRFYQPVAGLIGVARKNIQQALQKTRATRDLNELTTGDDIDEENLAAVRTTMRIFRDRGREPDKTRWCISLLIDASSSMHDETVARKLQATIQTAILFGEAVNRITGIQFEIAAFSDTEYIPLKRYQDEWNIHQGCYLIRQVIQATGGTNDVGAVSSALERMNRLRMAAGANRMVFVISDGQSGVGGWEQMRAILSTNKNTRIFGWGIGPDMEKIEETYRPYGTWVQDISDLPGSMGEVLRRELGRPAMTGWKVGRSDPGTDPDTHTGGEGVCTN